MRFRGLLITLPTFKNEPLRNQGALRDKGDFKFEGTLTDGEILETMDPVRNPY